MPVSEVGRNFLARRQGAAHSNAAHVHAGLAKARADAIQEQKNEQLLEKPIQSERRIEKVGSTTVLHPGATVAHVRIQQIRKELNTPSKIMQISNHKFFLGSNLNLVPNKRVLRPSRHKVFNW